jgi:phage pi2 protein 07
VDGMIERLVNKVLIDSRISKMLDVTFFAWVHYCGLGLC